MDINQIMKQAQQMQKQMMEAQAKQVNKEYVGSAAGGQVTVTIITVKVGSYKVHKIHIAPELVVQDEVDILEDLITAAFNDAMKKIDEDNESNMANLASMMGMPAGFKLPF